MNKMLVELRTLWLAAGVVADDAADASDVAEANYEEARIKYREALDTAALLRAKRKARLSSESES